MTRIVGVVLAVFWSVVAVADDRLPAHPGVVAGELDNGVSYRVMTHAVPEGRVSLRLHLPVGSLQETDDERGYAHLLEHVAFTGSENFPHGELTPRVESLGMTVGRHQNAMTGPDQTQYQLDLPNAEDETLEFGLTFLADVLGRLEVSEAGVAQERDIVLAERRNGLGPGQRMMEQWVPRVLEGSRAAERMVLGTEETLRAATAAKLKAFYERWYTTGNATVVLVGDLPVERAVAAIEQAFGALPARPATEPVDPGSIEYSAPFGVVVTDPEAMGTETTLVRLTPMRAPVTTRADARESLIETLAFMAFNRRIGTRVATGDASYQGGGAGASDFFGAGRLASASVSGEPENARRMLDEIATEVHRARKHGFSEQEIDTARTQMLAGMRQFARAQATLPSAMHASMIVRNVHEGGVLQSVPQQLELLEAVLPGITADEASAAFRHLYGPDRMAVLLLTKSAEGLPGEDEVLEIALKAFSRDVDAQGERKRPTEILARLPEPGTIVSESVDDTTGDYGAWLDNGVRVHHRFLDDRDNLVHVRITLAGGVIEETAETAGFTDAATGVLRRYATKSRSSLDLRDLMVGHTISVRMSNAPDAVFIDLSGTPDALPRGLQLVHLLISEPLLEPVSFRQWQRMMVQALEAGRTDVNVQLARIWRASRYPADDPRWVPAEPEDITSLALGDLQAWIEGLFRRAPIDVAVAGDIEREAAVALVAQYLGSLPSRERIHAGLFADRRDVPPPAAQVQDVTIESETPQAVVSVGFAGADHDAVDDVRALSQAARILTSRMALRIREQEGLVYSVSAGHSVDEALDGFSVFDSSTTVDPAHADRVAGLIEEMFAEFAANGPTEDEVEIAYRQFSNRYDETVRDPGYWARRLADLDYRATQRSASADVTRAGYRALTAERIHETFRRYHDAGTNFRYVVRAKPVTP